MLRLAEIFNAYKGCPIALYGLGTETEKALLELDEIFDIVGLLDGFREDGDIYGKSIISLSKCIEYGVKLIIVVARPGSCRAIAKRIGAFCMDNHIELLDVRGKNLCDKVEAAYDFNFGTGITQKQLMNQIEINDIISFDLFDTLIMRNVLFSTDVIELTAFELRDRGICIDDFYEKRLRSEKELSRDNSPRLEEIYNAVLDKSSGVEITAKELAELELAVDYSLVVPRKDMIDMMSYAYSQKKKVYIITDTYYSKEQLMQLLEKCGITEYTDILASCEYGTGKTRDLFGVLVDIAKGQSCLHIGDDVDADIAGAQRYGISGCRIYSGIDLFEMTGNLGVYQDADGISEKVKLGMLVAKLFNSPFQFEKKEKNLLIKTAYDIGYILAAPMITDFMIWFAEQVNNNEIDNIWLGARDGYLIKKLYDILEPENKAVYFLTSRMAAIRAGVENEQDIEYVAGMKFSGTVEQQLRERFGIVVDSEASKGKILSDFSFEILNKATDRRQNYLEYIKGLDLKEGKIAFFDFVAKGTSQMFIERIVGQRLKGFYFLQLEKEYMRDKNLDINAFFEDGEEKGCTIFEDYYILETILTAPAASVTGFDDMGKPYYATESRSKEDIECVLNVQLGIIDYFNTYLKICPKKRINKRLDEAVLSLIHNIGIAEEAFLKLKVEDPFFNRTTNITDVL